MSRLIVWESETRRFEFRVNKEGTLSMTIVADKEPLVNCVLTREDVEGIEEILCDLRYKLERKAEEENEVYNV